MKQLICLHGSAPLIQAGGLWVNRSLDPLLRQAHLDQLTNPAGSLVDHPQEVPPEFLPNKNIQDGVEATVKVSDAFGNFQCQPEAPAELTGFVDAQQLQSFEERSNVVGHPAKQEDSHHNKN